MRNSITSLVLGCLLLPDASACSCAPMTVRDFATRADSIFFATLQEAKVVAGSSKQWPLIEGKFVIYKTLKGDSLAGPMILSTPLGDSSCGVGMLVSAKYVIFKKKDDNGIIACGGSGILGNFGIIGRLEEDEVIDQVLAENKKTQR